MEHLHLKFRSSHLILAALVVLLLPWSAFAQTGGNTLVEVENLSTKMVFYPVTEFSELILTITGPCDFQYREVTTDGPIVFYLDQTTIDGTYTFNVMRNEKIDPEIIEVLLQARKNNDTETSKALCRDGKLPPAPLSQSSGFLISGGKIIYDPSQTEESFAGNGTAGKGSQGPPDGFMTKDFVINDDLIVDGSACIGFDCVNGESFGFDTIRLKENNLRIKFDDTSVAASFPSTDWQLTANASANGGASKFSIDDISGSRTPFTVEANARSHSLYVDDGGRIGNRTSTPSTEIHTIDGDTPTLRLQQDGSSGFAPQTWDVAGNETNFFIRDVTNGSTLPFRIRPGAPTSSIFIDVDGEVAVGHSSPDALLHVQDGGSAKILIKDTDGATAQRQLLELSNNGGVRFTLKNTTDANWDIGSEDTGNFVISVPGSGQTELRIDDLTGDMEVAGEVTADGVLLASDRNAKTDFESLDAADVLRQIAAMDITEWSFKKNTEVRHIGPMAQDFHAAFGLGPDDTHISPMDMAGVALKAIQQLEQEKADLATRVEALEALVNRLVEAD